MKTALYLDDVRTPLADLPNHASWVVVRNYEEFTLYIMENGVPDFVSFDHDLAPEHMNDYFNQVAYHGYQHPKYDEYQEKTGLDCARFLVDYCQNHQVELKRCAVHSHNPVGAANIQSFLNGFKKHMGWDQDCYLGKIPFTTDKP